MVAAKRPDHEPNALKACKSEIVDIFLAGGRFGRRKRRRLDKRPHFRSMGLVCGSLPRFWGSAFDFAGPARRPRPKDKT